MDRNASPETRSREGLRPERRSVTQKDMIARFLCALFASRTGAITAEYAVLIGFIGITGATAVVSLGPPIVTSYENTRGTILLPIP